MQFKIFQLHAQIEWDTNNNNNYSIPSCFRDFQKTFLQLDIDSY